MKVKYDATSLLLLFLICGFCTLFGIFCGLFIFLLESESDGENDHCEGDPEGKEACEVVYLPCSLVLHQHVVHIDRVCLDQVDYPSPDLS